MKGRRLIWIITFLAVALCALALGACDLKGYLGDHNVPDANQNEVLFIERNRLSFALGMEIDERETIAKCGCTFTNNRGEEFKVSKESLANGTVKYDHFELDSVGSNKQIALSYRGAVNYIYYDVNDYTANFYLDEEQTELYKTVKASAHLTDTLGLAVWVDLIQYNFSTDELTREYDADRGIRFNGWYDSSANAATGVYPLAAPVSGNERVINFHAHFLSDAELADYKLSYDASGRRVFSGYTGSSEHVHIPEGVTYVDFAETFKEGCTFTSLAIPSTASISVPFLAGINSGALNTITVDPGNPAYASYGGALYSKDYSALYYMPTSCKESVFHTALTVIDSYACAYWGIQELVIPEHIATLQHYCFAYSAIETVYGLEHVKTINAGVFFGSRLLAVRDGNIAEYIALTGGNSGKYILSMILDESITSYKLLDGTVEIAGDVFGRCKALVSVDLGDDLESIGSSAFSGCSSLTSIAFPASLKKMGSNVFYGCSALASVTNLPDVTYVDDDGTEYAHMLPVGIFRGCTKLQSVELPDKVTTIGQSAFYGCSGLTQIELPETVTNISAYGFYSCSALKQIELPAGLKRLGMYAFGAAGITGIDLSVCKNLTALPDYCFRSSKLQSIEIPEWIEAIPYRCFYLATALSSITFNRVRVIEDEAFAGCSALLTIDLEGVESIGYQAFQQCTKFTNIVLPDSVKYVGGYAFRSCTALQTLTLGKNVETFGDYSYLDDGVTFDAAQLPIYASRNVKAINVAAENTHFKSIDGVLYGREICGIDYGEGGVLYCVPPSYAGTSFVSAPSARIFAPYAAHYQVNLLSAVLNEGMENIGKAAFYASTKLQSLALPSTITNIGAGILLSCNAVKSFTIDEANKTYSSDGNLVYKGNALTMYLGFSTDIDIKEGITEIASAVFMDNAKITQISFPDSVTTIGAKAFSGCSAITSIHIGSGLKYLDPTAFALLQALQTITVSADNPYFTVENNVLYSKDGRSVILAAAHNGMTELNLKEGVTEIWDYAFSYNQTLASAVVPTSVKTIGSYAFYECRKIEYLYCSEALESIGSYAFAFDANNGANVDSRRCSDTLKTVLFYGNLKSIGDFAFNGQFGITHTFFKMTIAELTKLIKGYGANSVFFTHGCKNDDDGGYYNNDGEGIVRALYSEVPPTIDYNGYEWFYFDENGTPTMYDLGSGEERV